MNREGAGAARRFLVSGRVQGVGFRWFVRTEARRLGLSGFVRNLADGRVEVVAAGDAAALAELDRLLKAGPPGARVGAVEKTDVVLESDDGKSFDIR